jgi:small subunit ribosomal protein S16
MVRIRLRRVGKRKQPLYRVVVADSRSPRDGRFIEIIGQYNPLTNPSTITIDNDKALTWLRKGAQPSEQVKSLLKRLGIWSEYVKDKGPGPRKPKKHKAAPPTPKAAAEPKPAAPTEASPPPAEPSPAEPSPEEPAQAPATEAD